MEGITLKDSTLDTSLWEQSADLDIEDAKSYDIAIAPRQAQLDSTALASSSSKNFSNNSASGHSAAQGRIISQVLHNASAAFENISLTFVLSRAGPGRLSHATMNSMSALWIALVVAAFGLA